MERNDLLDRLADCPQGVFDKIVVYLGQPSGNFSSKESPQATRASQLVEWAEHLDGPGLVKLEDYYNRAIKAKSREANSSVRFRTALGISLSSTILVLICRHLGWLQSLELQAYDFLIVHRPLQETWDERVVVVGITRDDLKDWSVRYKTSVVEFIPYKELNNLLIRLLDHNPKVIGLDISVNKHSDDISPPDSTPVSTSRPSKAYGELAKTLGDNKDIIAGCLIENDETEQITGASYYAPETVEPERLGFANIVTDGGSNAIVRRHLMLQEKNEKSKCQPKDETYPENESVILAPSLSYQLAVHYLKKEKGIQPFWADDGYLKIGKTDFNPLPEKTRIGEYQAGNVDYDLSGYQVMLNYRKNNPEPITYARVMEKPDDQGLKDLLRDKIVIVGYVTPMNLNFKPDVHLTPLNSRETDQQKQMPGVFLHAHMTSQIISAVLDDPPRLLIQPFAQYRSQFPWIWITGWSLLSGISAFFLILKQKRIWVIISVIIIFGFIYLIYFVALGTQAQWLPLVSPLIAVGLTGVSLFIWSIVHERK